MEGTCTFRANKQIQTNRRGSLRDMKVHLSIRIKGLVAHKDNSEELPSHSGHCFLRSGDLKLD